MKIQDKIHHAKRAVESITRHEDEPLAVRRRAVELLRQYVDAELKAAEDREAARADKLKG